MRSGRATATRPFELTRCHRDGWARASGVARDRARAPARVDLDQPAGRRQRARCSLFASSATVAGVTLANISTSRCDERQPRGVRRPANYDLEQGPPSQARIEFWRRMAAQFGGPVLELCCGTGLVAIPVAAMGLSVTGVDLAAPMLAARAGQGRARGRRRALDRTPTPASSRCRAASASPSSPATRSRPSSRRPTSARCSATVHRHLAPEGVFGFETRNPAGHELRDEPEGPRRDRLRRRRRPPRAS